MVKIGEEREEEPLVFDSHSYQCGVYYVQSPSTASQPNSTIACLDTTTKGNNLLHESSPTNNHLSLYPYPYPYPYLCEEEEEDDNFIPIDTVNNNQQVLLSAYSTSHASSNSFLHLHPNNSKVAYNRHQRNANIKAFKAHHPGDDDEDGEQERHTEEEKDIQHKIYDNSDNEDDLQYNSQRGECWRYFSFNTYSSSCCWISLQISWRFMVSLSAALLVFFLATNPPTPKFSAKMADSGMGEQWQFWLREGVDVSGVATKILTCNFSVDINVDNKSKLFGLHIRPCLIQMSFGPLIFATSQGGEMYAYSHGSSIFQVNVGTKSKAMYGAGREMQDMLQSGKGLTLRVHLRFKSNFHVVWKLIKLRYLHHADCLILLQHDKSQAYKYNSSCRTTSS